MSTKKRKRNDQERGRPKSPEYRYGGALEREKLARKRRKPAATSNVAIPGSGLFGNSTGDGTVRLSENTGRVRLL